MQGNGYLGLDSKALLALVINSIKELNNASIKFDSNGNLTQYGLKMNLVGGPEQGNDGLIVNQEGSAPILRLQANGVDRFVVDNDGSVAVSAATSAGNSLFSIMNNGNQLFRLDANGDLYVSGEVHASAPIPPSGSGSTVSGSGSTIGGSGSTVAGFSTTASGSLLAGDTTDEKSSVLGVWSTFASLFNNVTSFTQKIVFEAQTVFRNSVAFMKDVLVRGNVEVEGHVIVSDDTAGQVIIPAGTRNLRIQFRTPYATPPIVTLTPVGITTARYGVDLVDRDGFTILLDTAQITDTTLNWMAVEVNRPVTNGNSNGN